MSSSEHVTGRFGEHLKSSYVGASQLVTCGSCGHWREGSLLIMSCVTFRIRLALNRYACPEQIRKGSGGCMRPPERCSSLLEHYLPPFLRVYVFSVFMQPCQERHFVCKCVCSQFWESLLAVLAGRSQFWLRSFTHKFKRISITSLGWER